MKIEVTEQELEILLNALCKYPNPEDYDFGPGYEIDRKEAQTLYFRLKQI